MFRALLAVSVLLGTAAPTLARTPQELSPISKWNVHYADNSCKLIRSFGSAAEPTVMMLERLAPDSNTSLLVAGSALRSGPGTNTARATFLPFADHRFESAPIAETINKKKTAIVWTSVDFLSGGKKEEPEFRTVANTPPIDIAERAAQRALAAENARKITGLMITEPSGRRTLLATGSMGRVHELMESCAREQLSHWGLDPDQQERIVLPAASHRSLASFFSSDDYPPDAFAKGEQAVISARLIVGADGKVANCTSLTLFRAPKMAEVVCRNLSRATFGPAELADGTKVPTYYVARVIFRM
jgi:hypothetical protein